MPVFYYFLKKNLTGEMREVPYITESYLGEVGDFCTIDGIGYTIVDYVVESM